MLRFRFLSSLFLCAAALGSASLAQAQAKLGVVNFQKAIADTQELKKASNDLTAKFKPRADELDKVSRDLGDTQTMLQNSQGKLSAPAQAELEAKAQRLQRQAERIKEDLDNDVNQERDATIQRLGSRMTEIVKKLMDDKGLDLILDTSATVSFKTTIDLTADATAAYDKAYPVSTSLAPPK